MSEGWKWVVVIQEVISEEEERVRGKHYLLRGEVPTCISPAPTGCTWFVAGINGKLIVFSEAATVTIKCYQQKKVKWPNRRTPDLSYKVSLIHNTCTFSVLHLGTPDTPGHALPQPTRPHVTTLSASHDSTWRKSHTVLISVKISPTYSQSVSYEYWEFGKTLMDQTRKVDQNGVMADEKQLTQSLQEEIFK